MRIFFFSVLLLSLHNFIFGENSSIDSVLMVLDKTLDEKEVLTRQKEKELFTLKEKLKINTSELEHFILLDQLIESYLSFDIDTATLYIQEQVLLAQKLNSDSHYIQSQLHQVSAYISTGMYYEAMGTLDSLDSELISPNLKFVYFNLYKRAYDALASFSIYDGLKKYYKAKVDLYRDSVISIHNSLNLHDFALQSDVLIADGEYHKAIELLHSAINNKKSSNHEKAILNHLLAQAWRGLNNHNNEKYCLIVSSVFDVKASVKEYVSLWQLAEMLFQEGDIDRSFKYLQISLEDATSGKMRLRTNSISNIYPIIEKAYQAKVTHQQEQLHKLLLSISILSIVLLAIVWVVLLQMKKIRSARRDLNVMNQRLAHLNLDLKNTNSNLKELNISILENSVIKEEYIGKYMEQCILYLDKMEEYRRWVRRNIQSDSKKELLKEIDSSKFMEEELKSFYNEFDHTFLSLFPTFVEEFNALLNPAELTLLKPDELLNTELRVYALIRLGISDSDKIARFLRYSLSTIYNYRTKVRNKAVGNREEFENLVMKIGLK